jgi:outer membrane lipoprotein LolB
LKQFALVLVALLAGCASEPMRSVPPLSLSESTIDSQRIEAIKNWSATGRVAIQRGNEGWSANMHWQTRGAQFQLRLVAPLGRGTYQLAGDDTKVELIVPDGGHFVASDAQSLMAEHLGWSIPLDGAQYWLRGLVAPDSTPSYINLDDLGRLLDLEQRGWRISVLRRLTVDNIDLPSKLFMHYKDLKVRIVISSWKLARK